MTDERVLEIIRRKTSIPEPGESFSEIEAAYDRAIEIIRQHIGANTNDDTSATGFYRQFEDSGDIEAALTREQFSAGTHPADAQVFLHGICGVFAIALHQEFGYDICELQDEDDQQLIHLFCRDKNTYIDIRGRTGLMHRLVEPFEDFFTEPLIIPRTVDDCELECINDMSQRTYQEYLTVAKQFIRDHKNDYQS